MKLPRPGAATLVRWYPKEWQARYGEEFAELLAADIAERPRCWARELDVALGAGRAHLAALGLSGTPIDPSEQSRRSLAIFTCTLAVFLTFALSICSHLAIAWRHAPPATDATHTAITVMTFAVILTLLAAAVGAIPVACTAIRTALRQRSGELGRPLLLCLVGLTVLITGGLAFHNGWPAANSIPWSTQSSGPGGPAAMLWTTTLAVSAYWAHPAVLTGLPASEIAWMAVSPAAIVATAVGAARTIRRLHLSIRLTRFVTHAAEVAVVGVGLCLAGTLAWLLDGGTGPDRLFQAGTVDRIGLAVMTASLIVAAHCIQQIVRASGPAVPS